MEAEDSPPLLLCRNPVPSRRGPSSLAQLSLSSWLLSLPTLSPEGRMLWSLGTRSPLIGPLNPTRAGVRSTFTQVSFGLAELNSSLMKTLTGTWRKRKGSKGPNLGRICLLRKQGYRLAGGKEGSKLGNCTTEPSDQISQQSCISQVSMRSLSLFCCAVEQEPAFCEARGGGSEWWNFSLE